MNIRFTIAAAAIAALAPSWAGAKTPELGQLRKVGNVHLPTSCAKNVQKEFDEGVALLHSFFYHEARNVFTSVAQKDPKCAMAQWGIAMTLWHPLWSPPNEEEMKQGVAAVKKAKELGGKTALEKGYIGALDVFYSTQVSGKASPTGQTCHGPTAGTHRERAIAYAQAMEKMMVHHPKDVEVASFYALGLMGAADPLDKSLTNQKKATEVLEKFYADRAKEHPGVLHYLIHGYDYPSVADKGLPAAQGYADVAPWVPHALHMPSHIFTRLGMWPEVIESNLASADASRKFAARAHPDARAFEELHALDYLAYAYLQQGQDAKAKEVAASVASTKKIFPEVDFAGGFAFGAVPARYALERKQWSEAANLQLPTWGHWEKLPYAEAHVVFARGLGKARTGKITEAQKEAERLEQLREASSKDPRYGYFAKQTATQRQAVLGWIAHAQKKTAEAEKLLREAATQDDALGKHPVSPGSLLPLREVLADFLLETGRAEAALAEYEATLKLNPKRLNSLYGAGQAAQRAGKKDIAKKYFGELMAQVKPDAQPRREIAEARAFLASK